MLRGLRIKFGGIESPEIRQAILDACTPLLSELAGKNCMMAATIEEIDDTALAEGLLAVASQHGGPIEAALDNGDMVTIQPDDKLEDVLARLGLSSS